MGTYNAKILCLFLEAEASLRSSNRPMEFFASQAQELKNVIVI